MATMWPSRLPRWLQVDTFRAAERKVFAQLERELDDTWHVFYSSPWWGIGRRGVELDGEADFIVAHPNHGILFIEVKGGKIEFDATSGKWSSTDRNGIKHVIKNPMNQAMTCKHEMRRKLAKLQGWPQHPVRFRHGVVLPDAQRPGAGTVSLGGHEMELFCFGPDFQNQLLDWVMHRLAQHVDAPTEAGPGSDGLSLLRKLVADDVKLSVTVAHEAEIDIQQMDGLLTGIQFMLVNDLLRSRRMVVEGGAGTGKTVIATELASRVAGQGERVLVLCSSTPLTLQIRRRLNGLPNADVMTVGELMQSRRGPNPDASTPAAQWDCVIVDEAQDIDSSVWDSVEEATSNRLFVFMDSNQAIYRLAEDLAARLGTETRDLTVNLRNTRTIAAVTEGLYKGPLVQSVGPVGQVPLFSTGTWPEMVGAATSALETLLSLEGVPASMVALLVDDVDKRSEIGTRLSQQGITWRTASDIKAGAVVLDTVSQFKGLEAPIVLLIADHAVADNPELSYVAVSRARSRLFVFSTADASKLVKALSTASPVVEIKEH